jgi:hypothetical protein
MSATSAATGSLVHWCRQCSVEHCELDRYLTGGRAGQRITGTVRYIPGP